MSNHKPEEMENQEHKELISEQEEATTPDDFQPNDRLSDEHQNLLANIQAELATMQKDHEELKDKYVRLFAEFDNHKRRTVKEKLDLMKTASQDIMTALLPVLDDFDRAKQNGELSEGIALIYNKLYNTLQNKGLEVMESNAQPFNPELHEALTEIPAPTDDLKGKVVDTIEKGYLLGEKIIRHAKVVVGK
ncbi:MAG: nucleotide exchange factor GrpE [Saprospiraceae bacterium]